MAQKLVASASPEKRLFISLITRDISLIDALLDIVDNAINAALVPLAPSLKSASDYQSLLADTSITPKVSVRVLVTREKVSVIDTADGIPIDIAQSRVFKFGHDDANPEHDENDRLSVYGIGLKRAMFKLGEKIDITSDHASGGFSLALDVKQWAADATQPWTFQIESRNAAPKKTGTNVSVEMLHDEVKRRIDDGLFLAQLKDRISRTYSFFIGRIVSIYVNDEEVLKEEFEIGTNYASEQFNSDGVSCSITAGIAASSGEKFRDRNAGWFVFCNGRAILFAEKSTLTGWGGGGLPIFQPKHRPFLGTVFFVSSSPEALPWTTTKSSVNQESAVWQEALKHMVKVGRVVTGFLDSRYAEDGTEVAVSELREASGDKVSVLTAAVAQSRTFSQPKKIKPKELRIQYQAAISDVEKIAAHLRRPGMGGAEVGRFTFNHFLKNEIGENE